MDEVFAVSRGDYSDYRVLCVCPTEEDAKTVSEKFNATAGSYGQSGVETIPLVTADVARVTELHLSTTLWDDGRETDEREHTRVEWPFDALYGALPVQWDWVRAPMHNNKGGRLDVRGMDHERVRKVFSDTRAFLLTDGAALTIEHRAGR